MLDKPLSFLGLLNKGGNLIFGETLLHSRNLELIILATDVAPAQGKKFEAFIAKNGLLVDRTYTKAQLGEALGYPALSAIGVRNKKAAKAYLEKLEAKE